MWRDTYKKCQFDLIELSICLCVFFLDVFPTHAGCYYILGFILFVLNRLDEALIPLRTGRLVDPEFEPVAGKKK